MHKRIEIAHKNAQLLEKGCVIIDLETTGFNSPTVDIIEIAIITHEGEILMDQLIKPQRPIPSAASAVNGIYDEDVADAPGFIEVYPKLLRHLAGQPVVAYNYTFEQGVLATVTGRYGLSLKVNQWVCAMRDYAKFKGYGRYAKLTNACMAEDITVENAHRALGDCTMTLHLMRRMAEHAAREA